MEGEELVLALITVHEVWCLCHCCCCVIVACLHHCVLLVCGCGMSLFCCCLVIVLCCVILCVLIQVPAIHYYYIYSVLTILSKNKFALSWNLTPSHNMKNNA